MMSGAPPAAGTVAVVRPDGETREVAGDVWFPNGMAITPDDTTLTVAESYVHRLTAFDITPDGGLSNRRVWAELGDAAPDGICLDAEGAVWYARRPPQALRPGPRGWRRAADDRGRSRLFRLHARGRRRSDPVHRAHRMGRAHHDRRR